MSKAFILKKTGDVKALKLIENKTPDPKEYEVQIKNSYITISHMDIHHRNGQYSLAKLPHIIGIGGAGRIVKLGSKVKGFEIDEKVVYGTNFIGSYSEKININQNLLIGLGDIPEDIAAASFIPGLTSHYLIYRTYKIKKGDIALVNGATGSVGHILCQWLTSIGADVIGIVGSDEKINSAKALGCKQVINYQADDYIKRVAEATNNRGANVIYDCYGKELFEKNIESLTLLGLLINYGDVTGIIDDFDVTKLWNKSLFYTKPNLFLYKGNRMELVLSAETLFKQIRDKVIRPDFKVVKFTDIPKAHQVIESRKMKGTIIAKV